MKKEKVVISFFAVLIGIIAAGIAFYFYQSTKTLSPQTRPVALTSPTPTPQAGIFLSVDTPLDESVTDKKTITITGKTEPDAIVVISIDSADEVITPTRTGGFSTTSTITDGTNRIEITAIAPNGEEATIVRTVSFSAEEF